MTVAGAAAAVADSFTPPQYPGAILALDGEGQIIQAWLGPNSPVASAVGDVFAALDVHDAGADAIKLQMLLACSCVALGSAWSMLVVDAPRVLCRRAGDPLLVQWQPIVRAGEIVAVAVFVTATELSLVEPDDPVERNRICVDALGLLDECEACARHLRVEPEARQSVHRMFRSLHTIKGSTRGARLRAIHTLAHEIEGVLDVLRTQADGVPLDVVDQLQADLSRLRGEIAAARPRGATDDAMTELGGEIQPALADLRIGITALARADRDALATSAQAVERIMAAADRAAMRGLWLQCTAAHNALEMMVADVIDPDLTAELVALDRQLELYRAVYRELAASDAGSSMVATLATWLDAPGDHAAGIDELARVLGDAGVTSFASALADPDPFASRRALAVIADVRAMFEPARPRDEASHRLERAQRDLITAVDRADHDEPAATLDAVRAIARRLVWLPLSLVARRVVRMTRTVASELGKQVAVEIDVGDVLVAPEIDRVAGEILIHALRNAIDHGIEAPEAREAVGKAGVGNVRVSARACGERVVITITDDGRGIDLDKVRRIGRSQGLVAADAMVSDDQAIQLLFEPGFSTVSTVTAVSGRGVGMDVIKCLAEGAGGQVRLTSRPGLGTELILDLPATVG